MEENKVKMGRTFKSRTVVEKLGIENLPKMHVYISPRNKNKINFDEYGMQRSNSNIKNKFKLNNVRKNAQSQIIKRKKEISDEQLSNNDIYSRDNLNGSMKFNTLNSSTSKMINSKHNDKYSNFKDLSEDSNYKEESNEDIFKISKDEIDQQNSNTKYNRNNTSLKNNIQETQSKTNLKRDLKYKSNLKISNESLESLEPYIENIKNSLIKEIENKMGNETQAIRDNLKQCNLNYETELKNYQYWINESRSIYNLIKRHQNGVANKRAKINHKKNGTNDFR